MVSLWLALLAVLVWEVTGQSPVCQLVPTSGECVCGDSEVHSYCSSSSPCAPDDFQIFCRTSERLRDEHILPDEWELMLDSHDYQNLIDTSTAVWVNRDFDGSGGAWLQRGGACQWDLRACAFASGFQNNWFFSQHIKYPLGSVAGFPTVVYLNITIRFSQCLGNSACPNPYINLYRYDTNEVVSGTQRVNTANYMPLFGPGTEMTDSRLVQVGASAIGFVREFVAPGNTGFYLGVQDEGTCGQVQRIYFYYTPCKAMQDGLVNYPELVRPPNGSPPNTAQACCAPNARVASGSSLNFRAYSASDGRCERNVVCECIPGYRIDESGTGCTACPAGTYRSSMDPQIACLNCPMNTLGDAVNASVCECIEGYYRDANEPPGKECTTIPSAPNNLSCSTTGNVIAVTWQAPSDLGGRTDTDYIVEYQSVTSTGDFIQDSQTNKTMVQIGGLDFVTQYRVRVVAENGVTDQEMRTGFRQIRTEDTICETLEGPPGPPSNIKLINNVVFLWQPPTKPNGIIQGYHIFISYNSSEDSGSVNVSFDASIFVYVLRMGVVPENVTAFFSVRANTSAGHGEFSDPIIFETFSPPVVVITRNVCTLDDMALALSISAVVAFIVGFFVMLFLCLLHLCCRKCCCATDKYSTSKEGIPNTVALSDTKVEWT